MSLITSYKHLVNILIHVLIILIVRADDVILRLRHYLGCWTIEQEMTMHYVECSFLETIKGVILTDLLRVAR